MRDHKDGMRYPSIDKLVEMTGSKYKLVIGAAMRARQIKNKEDLLVTNPHSKKSIGQALEEIHEGKVVIK